MASTFHGLEIAKRGMSTQQAALYTTGHNIANANTPGYSRQRVNFSQTEPYPAPSLNRPQIPGQMGTGVQAGSIQRMRDSFIDNQFRGENNKLGYWSAKSQALSSMETIMNEPTEQGLANTMDQFWKSLQDLSVTPQDSGTRSVVRQRGQAVADTFNYLSSSLSAIKENYKTEIDVTQKAVNSIIKQINDVNGQIGDTEVHGYLPNDLYDKRDLLLDELSTYMNIKIEAKPSGSLADAGAEGKFNIYLADNNGNVLKDDAGNPIKLVDGTTKESYGFSIHYDSSQSDNPVSKIAILKLHQDGGGFDGFELDPSDPANAVNSLSSFEKFKNSSSGSLISHIESYGYKSDDGTTKGLYPDMMKKLDEMAFTFAQKFNDIHRTGWSTKELETGIKDGKDFFAFEGESAPTNLDPSGAAKGLIISKDILESTDHIAASSAADENGIIPADQAFAGSGSNAGALANVKDAVLEYGGATSTVTSFYQSIIGDMGVKASQANQMTKNTQVLAESALTRRESVSSVSLDEEMTNMIKFQHAYNAAARNITMVDEMLDKIINSMGLVGR
ncbi:flagellar hook-associated protein FlgK [Cytobacillus sp. NCCP-133]|uniref:flagellar hook-associated protein FlgK n=1 Tax=Cytobacillus sp. NCCP-133 TaxID=766848 RepID=UPI00222F570A|nr:flagellar hook-associated protein FlgK [Cytobacillus sp. NCCP-133]GLB60193.1 flagellar hook-associated protein 1 [Cytobacillus sp. NCCP-133]